MSSFTPEEKVRVFKLSNGESIIGGYDGPEIFDFTLPLSVSLPLKMSIVGRGPVGHDSLSLSPWVHPMSEREYIDVNPSLVVMSAEASVGLTSYYNHCINTFSFGQDEDEGDIGPTDEELDEISIEEALDEVTDPDLKHTIH